MIILGITYQTVYHERHKWLERSFYVIVHVVHTVVIVDIVFFHLLILLQKILTYSNWLLIV